MAEQSSVNEPDPRVEIAVIVVAFDPDLVTPTFLVEHLDELEGVAIVGVDAEEVAPPGRRIVDTDLPDPVRLGPLNDEELGPIGAEIQRRLDQGGS